MQPKPIHVSLEQHGSHSPNGVFYLEDTLELLPSLIEKYSGKVKLIYMDPPYMTGAHFHMRVRVGEQQWKSGMGKLELPTFFDTSDSKVYLSMMRSVLEGAHRLLSEDGMLFLHVDWRTGAHLRLLLDEIFGRDNFVNEIIWAYQTGGRSTRHFSRKHDTILFYGKSSTYDFNAEEVKTIPTKPRDNHMRRHIDPDGRVYRSVRVNGRTYTYYDDDPVIPSDVWNDLSHLQQRDPERTGYDTQKPLALLDRIVRCGSRKGELVCDLFAGSGTTLEAAARLERRFIGVDKCKLAAEPIRRRLRKFDYALANVESEDAPKCTITQNMEIGFLRVKLESFEFDSSEIDTNKNSDEIHGLDAIDSWSVGYLEGDTYRVAVESLRMKHLPKLEESLALPVFTGQPAMAVTDVLGHTYYYLIQHDLLKHNS